MGLFFSSYYTSLKKAMKRAEKAYKEERWSDCYYASTEASHFLGLSFNEGDLAGSVYTEWGEKIDKMLLDSKYKK